MIIRSGIREKWDVREKWVEWDSKIWSAIFSLAPKDIFHSINCSYYIPLLNNKIQGQIIHPEKTNINVGQQYSYFHY